MEREYIVALKEGVNYDEFWNEIENLSPSDSFVPSRRVEIANERPGSLRSCHYLLTDTEAEFLKKDPRVQVVEIPPSQRTDINIGFRGRQSGDFTKTTSDSGSYLNWGLKRCISPTNNYGTGTTVSGDFTYPLDGTGVDIVIQDSGIQVDHPEFQDANGVNRVQQINWYTSAGIPGTQSSNHYRDYDGHGTHVAGIAAGKTYGWAKNSRIYSMKVNGLEGSGDSNTGIPVEECFDLIKLWHRNKPIDPITGYKRPTIVNMSWGYGIFMSNIIGGVYRTDPWTGNTRRPEYGMIGAFYSAYGLYRVDVRVDSIDVDIEEMLAEGIHICVAAGNSYQKIDVPDGQDYDNYYTTDLGGGDTLDIFYNRGGSPQGNNAIIVGSSDSAVYDASTEQKSVFSNCGPGVDLYAPGSNILSCTSTINSWGIGSQPYYLNSSYRQTNISGTSMASPQVCGYGAQLLQSNPKLTPAQLKDKILKESQNVMYSTGLDNDYDNPRSVSNGDTKFMYQKFNGENPYNSSVSMNNVDMRLI